MEQFIGQEVIFIPQSIKTQGKTKKNADWYVFTGYDFETSINMEGMTFSNFEIEKPVKVLVEKGEKGFTFKRVEAKEATEPAPVDSIKEEAPVIEKLKEEGKVQSAALIPAKKEEMSFELMPADTNLQILLAKAEIDIGISTAKAFPRSITKFLQDAETIVSLDEETAASCSYSLPAGNKIVEGGSIRLAEIVCSTYENIRADAMIVEVADKYVVAKGVCHDMERNNYQSSEVRVSILDKNNKRYNDHMIRVTCNAACAKAKRNAIFAVVPGALVNKIRMIAKKVAAGSLKTLPERRDKAIKYFKDLGIKESQICEKLEVAKIGDIGIDEFLTLQGFATAINSKEATVEEIFNKPSEEMRNEAGGAGANALNQMDGSLK